MDQINMLVHSGNIIYYYEYNEFDVQVTVHYDKFL